MTTTDAAERLPPRYLRDMDPIERAYTEAAHEGCEDGPPHDVAAHEPFDVEGVEPWAEFTATLARHGLRIVDDAALAAERRATVERIRAEVHPDHGEKRCRHPALHAILDAEAER